MPHTGTRPYRSRTGKLVTPRKAGSQRSATGTRNSTKTNRGRAKRTFSKPNIFTAHGASGSTGTTKSTKTNRGRKKKTPSTRTLVSSTTEISPTKSKGKFKKVKSRNTRKTNRGRRNK